MALTPMFDKELAIELSEYADPGDMIIVLGINGSLTLSPAMLDTDLMWVVIDPEGLSEEGELERLEPEEITAWRPAYVASGIPAEYLTMFRG